VGTRTPSYRSGLVAKCGSRPIYFGLRFTLIRNSLFGSVYRQTLTKTRSYKERRYVGSLVIFTDRGPWCREAVLRRNGLPQTRAPNFGLRSSVESSYTSNTGPGCSTTTSTPTLFSPLVGFL